MSRPPHFPARPASGLILQATPRRAPRLEAAGRQGQGFSPFRTGAERESAAAWPATSGPPGATAWDQWLCPAPSGRGTIPVGPGVNASRQGRYSHGIRSCRTDFGDDTSARSGDQGTARPPGAPGSGAGGMAARGRRAGLLALVLRQRRTAYPRPGWCPAIRAWNHGPFDSNLLIGRTGRGASARTLTRRLCGRRRAWRQRPSRSRRKTPRQPPTV